MKQPEFIHSATAPHARERGSAVVVLLALLAIMLILVAANGKTLLNLQKELRLIERQQLLRLHTAQTNAPYTATPPGDPPPKQP